MQALAGWLERRPQLGRDVFARGQPEMLGVAVEPRREVDVVEFLWASMALFETADGAETATVYGRRLFELHPVAAARARILQRLAELPDGGPLAALLPATPANGVGAAAPLGLDQTLAAGLEWPKQGDVVLAQDGGFQPIHVARA